MEQQYDAFISYSHAKDKPIARALQGIVQKLGKAWYRRRALRLFRDDSSLSASSELWPEIEAALSSSRYFILLASPEAARSPWVEKEVRWWLEHRSIKTLLIALTGGANVVWAGEKTDFAWTDDTPLPSALEGRFTAEPLWIDLRQWRDASHRLTSDTGFQNAAATLAATLHGRPKDELLSDELKQQRRVLRLAGAALMVVACFGAVALWQRSVAIDARAIAEEKRDQALRNQSVFLASAARSESMKERVMGGHSVPELKQRALLLAIEALAELDEGHARPYVPEAHQQLFSALATGGPVGHLGRGPFFDFVYSPDGKHLASASWAETAQVWNSDDLSVRHILKGHKAEIRKALFSADSKYLTTSSADKTIIVWNLESGKKEFQTPPQEEEIGAFALNSANGRAFLSFTAKQRLQFWDVLSNKLMGQFPNVTGFASSADFAYSLVFAEQNSEAGAVLLNNRTKKTVGTWSGLMPANVRWHPRQPELAIRDGNGTLTIIDAQSGAVKATANSPITGTPYTTDSFGAVPDFSYSPDGSVVLAPAGDHVELLDSLTLKKKTSIPAEAGEADLWFDRAWVPADGRFIVTSRHNEGYHEGDDVFAETRIWDSSSGRLLFKIPDSSMALRPDGQQLITTSGAVWSLAHIGKLAKFEKELSNSKIVAVSGDERLIAVADGSANALIRDAETLAVKAKLAMSSGGDKTMLFASTGTRVVAFAKGGDADVFDVGSDRRELSSDLKISSPVAAQFDDKGEKLVTVHGNGELRIWDIAKGTLAHTVKIADGKPRAGALSPDGRQLAVTLEDDAVRLFDIADGKEIWRHALDGPLVNFSQEVIVTDDDMRFFTVAFSGDGRQIAASSGAFVNVLDAATGKASIVFKGHGCPVRALRFAENDEVVASSSSDQPGNIWRMKDGQLLGQISSKPGGSPVDLCAGKQEQHASISNAGRIVIYSDRQIVNDYSLPLDYQELLTTAKKQALRCLTSEERKEFFLDPTPPQWCYAMKKWPFEDGSPQAQDTPSMGSLGSLWNDAIGYLGNQMKTGE